MPKKAYHVKLKDQEFFQLRYYVQDGSKSTRAVNRARILLMADEQLSDEEIAETLGVGLATIHRTRKHYNDGGVSKALEEKQRSGAPSKIDGRFEATLTMLACSEPPAGGSRWTLQLLADKLVELKIVDDISLETVRTVLKKTNLNLGSSNAGV